MLEEPPHKDHTPYIDQRDHTGEGFPTDVAAVLTHVFSGQSQNGYVLIGKRLVFISTYKDGTMELSDWGEDNPANVVEIMRGYPPACLATALLAIRSYFAEKFPGTYPEG